MAPSELQQLAQNVDQLGSSAKGLVEALTDAAKMATRMSASLSGRHAAASQQALGSASTACRGGAAALIAFQKKSKSYAKSLASYAERAANPVMRSDSATLFRGDRRSPEDLQMQGFTFHHPGGDDLGKFVAHNQGNYISASRSSEVADVFGDGPHYVYAIQHPGGIDVNKTLPSSKYYAEHEVAYTGPIPFSHVHHWYMVDGFGNRIGSMILNPHFIP